jgi:regulator of sigma E protease
LAVLENPIVAALVMLGILIFFHELGHYLVGKICGIAVEIFSIGFGPVVFKFVHHQTNYQLCLIPLGGFVKFYGSLSTEELPPVLKGKPFWKASKRARFLTVAAGPLANILLAIVAYFVLAYSGLPYIEPTVGFVRTDSPAATAGVQPGDRVTEIENQSISSWSEMEKLISAAPGKELNFVISREDKRIETAIIPARKLGILDARKAEVGRIGIASLRILPIVAISDFQSKAYLAGVRTKDLVREVKCGNAPQLTFPINFFDQVVDGISQCQKLSASDVQINELILSVERTSFDKEEKLNLDINIAGLKTSDFSPDGIGINDAQLVLASVTDNSKLSVHDVIVAVNGVSVRSQFDVMEQFREYSNENANVVILRDGVTLDFSIKLSDYSVETPDGPKQYYRMSETFLNPFSKIAPKFKTYSAMAAVSYGVSETLHQSGFLLRVLSRLFTGEVSVSSMGGPLLIAKVAGDAAKRGWQVFINTLALISINLAVVNLFPIPVLDGGQIVLIIAETLKRRAISIAAVENYQRVGFVMIMALMILVFYNDLNRFWSEMVQGIIGSGG